MPPDVLDAIVGRLSPWDNVSLLGAFHKTSPVASAVHRVFRDPQPPCPEYFHTGIGVVGSEDGREVSATLTSLILCLRAMLPAACLADCTEHPQIAELMRSSGSLTAGALFALPQIRLYWLAAWYFMVVAADPRGYGGACKSPPLPPTPTILPQAARLTYEVVSMGARNGGYFTPTGPTHGKAWVDVMLAYQNDIPEAYSPMPMSTGVLHQLLSQPWFDAMTECDE